MIDYTINVYALISLSVLVGSSLYALGQWTRKQESTREASASKSDVAVITSLATVTAELTKDKLQEISRRISDLEHSGVRKDEFHQFQARVEAFERALARLEDR